MDAQELEKTRSIAEKIAKYFGFANYSEDIAQEVVLLRCKSELSQSVKQTVIDVIRKQFGRNNESNRSARQTIDRGYMPGISDPMFHVEQNDLDFLSLVSRVKGRLRAVLILRFVWGLTNKEIGIVFGVTEGRIGQLMSEALSRMKTL